MQNTTEIPQQIANEVVDILQRAAKTSSSSPQDLRSQFWSTYQSEAEDYDAEFLKNSNNNLDIVLIFSGLFSAVSTTFIQGMIGDLSPDPDDTTHALLQLVILSLNNSGTVDQNELPSWDGPSANVIWTQCLLYASLSASLLAAFGAVLAKQWISHYARTSVRGSVEARCKSRQQKLYGIERWHFRAVIEVLPLLLQVSLLLFGIGMAAFIWEKQHFIGGVIIVSVGIGLLFYIFIVIASLISPYCPFHTPVAQVVRFTSHIPGNCWRRFKIIWRGARRRIKSRLSDDLWDRVESWAEAFSDFAKYMISPISDFVDMMTPSESGLESIIPTIPQSDAVALAWILDTCIEPKIAVLAMQMIPDVDWPPGLDVLPSFRQICDAFVACLEFHHDVRQLPPAVGERALVAGKALLHLYFEGKNRGDDLFKRLDDNLRFHMIRRIKPSVISDPDLCFVSFLVLSSLVNSRARIPPHFVIPEQVAIWFHHSILNMLCQSFDHPNLMPRMVEIVKSQLSVSAQLPDKAVADLLLGVGVLMGMKIDPFILLKVDKSQQIKSIFRRVLCQFPSASSNTSAHHAITTFEAMCRLIIHRFPDVANETEFPLWAFWYSRRLASSSQHEQAPDSGSNHAFPEDAAQWALVLSGQILDAARDAQLPHLEAQRIRYPDTFRFGNVKCPVREYPLSELAGWLVDQGCQLKDNFSANESDINPDVLFAVLLGISCFPSSRIADQDKRVRIPELISFSMNTSQSLAVRRAAVDLMTRLYFDNPCPAVPLLKLKVESQFLSVLRSTVDCPPSEEYSLTRHFRHDLAYLKAVTLLSHTSNFSVDAQLYDHSIDQCYVIARCWTTRLLVNFLSRDAWTIVLQLFIRHGWMPEADPIFVDQMHAIAWETYQGSSSYRSPDTSLYRSPEQFFRQTLSPLIVETASNPGFDWHDVFKFHHRVRAGIQWLEYFRHKLVSAQGLDEHLNPRAHSDTRIVVDMLAALCRIAERTTVASAESAPADAMASFPLSRNKELSDTGDLEV